MPKRLAIIGGGLAGLSAAIEAIGAGSAVHLIEGEKDVGGNSAKASSGINGVGSPAQARMNIDDSKELFSEDTIKAGDEANDRELVEILVRNSTDALSFLVERGVDLGDVNLCGGHSRPRTHWIPSPKEGRPCPVGFTIIRALKAHLEQLAGENPDRVSLSYNTRVEGLIVKDGRVVGVDVTRKGEDGAEVKESLDSFHAVILTTGGFSNDHSEDSLLKEFNAAKLAYPSTNGPFAQGSGVKMARKVGAKLRDMEAVQVHPTAFVDPADPAAATKFLAAEALRGKGALLLDQKGGRFCNELGRRDRTTEAIEAACGVDGGSKRATAWMLMNSEAVESFGWPAFNFYFRFKKFFNEYPTFQELCQGTGMEEGTLRGSLTAYAACAKGEAKDAFGKTVFPVVFEEASGPFYAAKITPAIHYTMGGLQINACAQVMAAAGGKPVGGLFAAGEVSGGVHGRNRLGGNSLLECVVFGRIAGQTASLL